tara:strand:+ start:791 stop:970 length:180 start_codon:yes stop_codon:yes gene_type:complete
MIKLLLTTSVISFFAAIGFTNEIGQTNLPLVAVTSFVGVTALIFAITTMVAHDERLDNE